MLQDAQPDDTIILWNYKGYSNLHGSINCTDNIGLDLRIPAGSCVSLNLFIRPKYSLVPTTLRLYWIGLYEGRESNKSNWFFQVDLAAATIYGTKRIVGGGKHTHVAFCGACINANERTYSRRGSVLLGRRVLLDYLHHRGLDCLWGWSFPCLGYRLPHIRLHCLCDHSQKNCRYACKCNFLQRWLT